VRLARGAERLAGLQARSTQAMTTNLVARRQRLDAHAQMLTTLSYKSVLGRGYAVLRDAHGRAIRSIGQVAVGTGIDIEVGNGRIAANVTGVDITPGTSTAASAPPIAQPPKPRASTVRSAKTAGGGGPQGSLFDLTLKETDGG
jgi:exodeoxyribonuclease VII large subunit